MSAGEDSEDKSPKQAVANTQDLRALKDAILEAIGQPLRDLESALESKLENLENRFQGKLEKLESNLGNLRAGIRADLNDRLDDFSRRLDAVEIDAGVGREALRRDVSVGQYRKVGSAPSRPVTSPSRSNFYGGFDRKPDRWS